MSATLELRLTGGAANTDPELSLGGDASSEPLSTTAMNNLFADVSPTERENGSFTYKALSIHNKGDAIAASILAYMGSNTSNDDTHVEFGLDSTTQSIVNCITPPTGVTFAQYTKSFPLTISDIAINGAQRIWVKRVVNANADNDVNDLGSIAVIYV